MSTFLQHHWTTDAVWHCPAGWRQGRGAWGGMVSGQIFTAVSAHIPDGHQIRSAHISMLGAVPAAAIDIAVVPLRLGSATASFEVTLRHEDQVLTRATLVTGSVRAETAVSSYRPGVPASLDLSSVHRPAGVDFIELGPPLAPEFVGQLRFAPVSGIPYSGQTELRSEGWVSLPAGATDEPNLAMLAAMVDAWWTAALVGLDGAKLTEGIPPMATLDYVVQFPQQLDPYWLANPHRLWDIGLRQTSEIVAGRDGYLTEVRSLFSPDGTLLAYNPQLVAVGRGQK